LKILDQTDYLFYLQPGIDDYRLEYFLGHSEIREGIHSEPSSNPGTPAICSYRAPWAVVCCLATAIRRVALIVAAHVAAGAETGPVMVDLPENLAPVIFEAAEVVFSVAVVVGGEAVESR
jgi:hypothetical protein